MIYFTADNHFGRKDDGKEAIERWNAAVAPDDTVYIAGDLFSYNVRDPFSYLEKLNGRKILILGNNDPFWVVRFGKAKAESYFDGVAGSMTLQVGEMTVGLSHYPCKVPDTDVLICGHIHKATKVVEYKYLISTLSLNAGEMICDGAPVCFGQLIEYNKAFYKRIFSEKEEEILSKIENGLK